MVLLISLTATEKKGKKRTDTWVEQHVIPFVHRDVSYTNDEVSNKSVQEMLSC